MADGGPPGRARRVWLLGRLQWAGRARDLLDRKRQVLRFEDRRLRQERDRAGSEWVEAGEDARRWALRFEALAGGALLAASSAALADRAEVTVSHTAVLGVRRPAAADVELPAPPAVLLTTAAGPLLDRTAEAHRRALRAAAAYSVADSAYRAVHDELKATERRQRAIERIRIPALEAELEALTLWLDEMERQERVLGRWSAGERSATEDSRRGPSSLSAGPGAP